MTILKKHDKAELKFLIDCEMQAYAIAVQGRQLFYKMGMQPEYGEFNKHGAITQIVESTSLVAMQKVKELLDKGASICTTVEPTVNNYVSAFYVVKSEAEQAEDAKLIAAEVEAKYNADIDLHNEKVFAQEAEALKAEEAAMAIQLRAEDEQRIQAEFEKRVRERLRGSKGGAK